MPSTAPPVSAVKIPALTTAAHNGNDIDATVFPCFMRAITRSSLWRPRARLVSIACSGAILACGCAHHRASIIGRSSTAWLSLRVGGGDNPVKGMFSLCAPTARSMARRHGHRHGRLDTQWQSRLPFQLSSSEPLRLPRQAFKTLSLARQFLGV